MYSSKTAGYSDNNNNSYSDQKPDLHGQPVFTGVPVNPTYPSNNSEVPPTALHPRPVNNNVPWSHGLFDCFDDLKTCCISCWCPCVTLGRIAEIVDEGSTSSTASGGLYTLLQCLTGCGSCYSFLYRSKMRKRYQLQEHPCSDCLVHFFCEACALTQEYRELERRGFDMSIGWQGNVNRRSDGIAMAPIPPAVQGGMMR